ncbi:E3 ubiquitin-protein ligase UPL4 [Hordeum vulgare]|uniref:HECT-type E3 ubiquitin transferase n=1 Tax=Hordeum vulgare subsp. vulgare TaxID=112509 RepID=A0A8I6X821_HORVV|nr:E3 ubiquitin-protein ligase UPL4 isoform X2 [Hordeum vulgare subsp. vulgare]KAE8812510.1 E3 ubiquitin-protein ligase UPL4 [Hordeum vulgare]
MDRCRKRPDSDPGGSGEAEPPADKRPCTAEPSTSAAAAPPEQAASDMDTSSSGHPAEGDGDADGDADVDGDDGDGGSSCESDGDGGSGPGASKFRRMVAAVASEGAGGGALLASLTELCEALSFCTEDAGGYFPVESAARALVRLAGADVASPDEMLLAVRAITYLCDAMPRAADAVVRHGLLPVLCSRLLAIEYLDVAEQCLQAFEKISLRQPAQCLQAGMITAVLTYIDFFAASIQRVAVSAVANACKKVPADCSQFVMDSTPMLCNLLQSEDKMVVEKVATCLISIVDSFSGSVELLDQLCHQGLVEKVLPLINASGLTSLNPSTCSNLIGLLAKLACNSLVAVKSLFELNVGSTIRGILVSSDLSHGMPYLPSENQNNQVNEALKLAIQLIPSAARDVEDTYIVLAKEKILVDEPGFLCQFSADVLPILIKAVNSGANSYICYGCSSIVNNICYFSKPEMLQELLKETNISSFLAGLLSRKDHHVLISSLKIIEILMQKLPDAYLGSFIKEGVVYAVEALLMQEDCSKSSPPLSDDTQQLENQPVMRNKPTCFCYAFDSRISESTETRACRIGQGNLPNFARHVKTTYFTAEAVNSEMGLTEILQKLKTCCAVLNDSADKSLNQDSLQNEEHLSTILSEVLMELHGGETMTTFEFLESGLVKSLLNYLSNGKYLQVDDNLKDYNADHFCAVLKRFQSFARICFSRMEQGWGDMLLTLLVRKLQNALTSLDNFPVIMSHNFKPRSNVSDIPIRHSTISPCIRVCFKKDEDDTKLSSYDNAVNLEISSSLDSIEQFLWPKVSTGTSDQNTESSPSSVAFESKYAEDDPQERDSSPESSPSSEGITRENQNSSAEPCSKKGSPSSAGGQPEKKTSTGTDCALQPKLVFSLKGKELDRSVTLYQSVLQDQINAGADVILDTQFWRTVHDITFRTAANPENDDSPKNLSIAALSTNDSKTGLMWQTLPFFSSLLLGKIPCRLDRSSPSYDILFMLKVLEGLNRYSFHLVSNERNHAFAQGRITDLDDLKPSVSSVPLQEFVSAKLTDKLEQQMHDPLVLRSRCLPLWCTELMSACPFLFSFEARWKYFQLTAFGSSSMQRGHMIETSGSNVATERASSFSRKKFKVDRDDILASAVKMMRSYAKSNALLEVEYAEEVGTGLGPTMEFYTLISHEFQKSGLGMWRGELPCEAGTDNTHVGRRTVVAPNGLFPRPWSASVDCASFSEANKSFHLLGQVLAKAIKDGRILDIPFSKAFYKLILGQELNIYDINSFDPELAMTLMEFKALTCQRKYVESCSTTECQSKSDLSYRGCKIEDLAIDFTVPGFPEYVFSSEGTSDNVTGDNLEEYVSFVVEATVKSGITRQLEAFESGFSQVFPLSTLRVFSEDELERLLCGEQDNWDFVKLVDNIKFDHGYTSSSPAVINLLEIIQEFECHERRAFLQFITGSPRLPPGGLAALNPNLTVVRKHSNNDADDDLPSVMTCANYLKLPAYCSKERMREKLLYAITEGQGSFHLS